MGKYLIREMNLFVICIRKLCVASLARVIRDQNSFVYFPFTSFSAVLPSAVVAKKPLTNTFSKDWKFLARPGGTI